MTAPRTDGQDPTDSATATAAARAGRQGFALPLALVVIAVLTVTLAAGFASTATEIITNNSQRAEARAFALAENGLQEFVAMRDQKSPNVWCAQCGSPPTTTYESTTVNDLPGGYAEVVAQRVMKNVGIKRSAVYLIRSRGVDTVTRLGGRYLSGGAAGNVRAERIVAQYAYWDVKTINIVSGWTSLSGLTVKGGSGTISGADSCGANPAVAGAAVPDSAFTQTGNGGVATGSPNVLNLGPLATAVANTHIDWPGIVNGTSITPDIILPANGTLPNNYFPSNPPWPIIHVKGDYSISSGQGMLIIDGNATFGGSGTWHGIILVGGNLTSNGTNNVYGAVITGLNTKLGQTVSQDDAGHGTKFYQYNSCDVAAATSGIGHYRLFPNAWMDNFTTY
jgi:Tfp pilus assembly protein PilX